MRLNNQSNILVVIAARAGSKGLRNKNIRRLVNRPLIAYTIQQAISWKKSTDVVCSTDSRKIVRIAESYGAKAPFIRPKSLATDNSSKVDVLRHALLECEKIYKKNYEIIVDLDVTSPIRKIRDLDNCLRIFQKNKPDTLFSTVKSKKNPYFNMVELDKEKKAYLCKVSDKIIVSRQKAPKVYDMNASIYFYRRRYLIDKKNRTAVSDNSMIYPMESISSLDIDTELDFKYAEFLIKERIWKSEV